MTAIPIHLNWNTAIVIGFGAVVFTIVVLLAAAKVLAMFKPIFETIAKDVANALLKDHNEASDAHAIYRSSLRAESRAFSVETVMQHDVNLAAHHNVFSEVPTNKEFQQELRLITAKIDSGQSNILLMLNQIQTELHQIRKSRESHN